MLVVDINTLHTVNALNLTDKVIMNRVNTGHRKNIVGIYGAFGEKLTFFNMGTFDDLRTKTRIIRNKVLLNLVGVCDYDVVAALDFLKGYNTRGGADYCK